MIDKAAPAEKVTAEAALADLVITPVFNDNAPFALMDPPPAKPPWPKKEGYQCCLCLNYQGNDPRGPLWSGFGLCKIAPIQYKVTPELVCEKFQFDEALRGS